MAAIMVLSLLHCIFYYATIVLNQWNLKESESERMSLCPGISNQNQRTNKLFSWYTVKKSKSMYTLACHHMQQVWLGAAELNKQAHTPLSKLCSQRKLNKVKSHASPLRHQCLACFFVAGWLNMQEGLW